MKKIIIALLVAGIASLVGYTLLSGEHTLSVGTLPDTISNEFRQTITAPATIPPFKGHRFQTLINFSNELNAILFNRELTAECRAEQLVAKGAPMNYDELVVMAHDSDYACYECCDGPCFAAIQDSIIRSNTDETLDVYWYYEVQGQDSVLMFDMERYKMENGETAFLSDPQTTVDTLNEQAAKDNENAERFFSPDMRYAAFVSHALDPYLRDQLMTGESLSEEEYPFIDGICLTDRNSGSTYTLVEPGQKDVCEHIGNLVWNLESDVIYFTSYGDTAGSSGVYSYSLATRKVAFLSGGGVVGLILDEPHIGWLKILNSCFFEGKGGRYWYYAALSPDGKTEIRLTEPSMDIPED